jgi:hypothetical protein
MGDVLGGTSLDSALGFFILGEIGKRARLSTLFPINVRPECARIESAFRFLFFGEQNKVCIKNSHTVSAKAVVFLDYIVYALS